MIAETCNGFVALPGGSSTSTNQGGNTYSGPKWTGMDAGYPWVMDDTRGFWVIHPSTNEGGGVRFVAALSGKHRFVGDFARASGSPTTGDGVTVAITGKATIFAARIAPPGSGITISANDPFATAQSTVHFDETVMLSKGDVVHFSVFGKSEIGFDATALQVAETVTPDASSIEQWCLHESSEVGMEPAWYGDKLGSGSLELRRLDGQSSYVRHYSLEYKNKTPDQAIEIESFFRARGHGSFTLYDPDNAVPFRACLDGPIRRRQEGSKRSLSVPVREVFEP